jgi:hypothetical protein
MEFDIITLLRRLAICVGCLIAIVAWAVIGALVGGAYGPGYAFALYISPGLFSLLYLMGLK